MVVMVVMVVSKKSVSVSVSEKLEKENILK
jgi:hypothetical protein